MVRLGGLRGSYNTDSSSCRVTDPETVVLDSRRVASNRRVSDYFVGAARRRYVRRDFLHVFPKRFHREPLVRYDDRSFTNAAAADVVKPHASRAVSAQGVGNDTRAVRKRFGNRRARVVGPPAGATAIESGRRFCIPYVIIIRAPYEHYDLSLYFCGRTNRINYEIVSISLCV